MAATITIPGTKHEWYVSRVDSNSELLFANGKQNWGTTHFKNHAIYVDCSLGQETEQVLIHELTHALIFETQVQQIKKLDEEEICDMMGMYARTIIKLTDQVLGQWKEEMREYFESV